MSRRAAQSTVRKADEVPLSEIVEADIDRVDGVMGPANGTPVLLMKSLPDEPPSESEPVVKVAPHEPHSGTHRHPHPAMGAQGGGDTHEHEHSHDGDADHGHGHPVEKAEMSGAEVNDLPDDVFAHIEPGGEKDDAGKTTPRSLRHYPTHDKAHADNAASRAAAELSGEGKAADIARAAMPKIKAAQKKFGSGEAKKAIDGEEPGSPAWEAQDAATLRGVATQLAALMAKLEEAAGRERAEVDGPAGDPDDLEDAWDLDDAVTALNCALGIVARLAFTEQQEAVQPDGVMKAGRRLSTKTTASIQAARDELTRLLGLDAGPEESQVDVPAPPELGGTDVTKAELAAALDERLAPLLDRIAKALPGIPDSEGARVEPDTARMDAERARQDKGGKPGQEKPPEEPVEMPDAGTELPGMEEAKRAETAPDANPRLAKGTTAQNMTTGTAAEVVVTGQTQQPAMDMEGLAKALAESEGPFVKALESTVAKSVEGAVAPLRDGMAALEKRVQTIADQPMPGGPMLNGAASRQQDHYLVVRRPDPTPATPMVPTGDAEQIRKALESLRPEDRDLVGRALALQASPFQQQ